MCLAQSLYEIPAGVNTRWTSFENPSGAPGQGGKSNDGRKGAAFAPIKAGATVILADLKGPGVIRRMWCTVRGVPELLRGLVLKIYWDGQEQASVEAPLQDFFGIPFARQVKFESVLFSNPEKRSFNCFVPMPFSKSARVVIENQAARDAAEFFYDINVTLGDVLPQDLAYFHARFSRQNPTTAGKDFEILPRVEGRGRYLGCNVGIRPIRPYSEPVWFGEGEMKIYLDDDHDYPSLVGTGTEDMVGSAWGLGRFDHLYQGCLLSEKDHGVWGFYRYHIPDPVYFRKAIRVTLQQISGSMTGDLKKLPPESYPELVSTHRKFDPSVYPDTPDGGRWENFEAPQDVCATAYWYQVLPSPKLDPLQLFAVRMKDLFVDR
jgi:hypothetical protein